MAYERVRTTSSKASPPDISQESKIYFNSHTNEQHSGFDTFKTNGGNQPRSLKEVADLESSRKVDSPEWVLCRHVFCNLCLTPIVDLLASSVSHQVAQCVAWQPDSYSIAMNAMSIPWTQGHCYTFPPFCLIPRVLSKVQQRQVHTVTLITPC